MAFLIGGANSAADTGFSVANSCRFNDGDSPQMIRTLADKNQKTFTFSVWLKRSIDATDQHLFGTYTDDNNRFHIYFDNGTGQLWVLNIVSGSSTLVFKTNRVFRDCSAWINIVVAVDTTQGTEGNRVKIYINGTRETSWATETYPSEDADMYVNNNLVHYIGRNPGATNYYFDGYMAELVWIDGTQYAASDFGEFDEDSPNIWKPKDVSGLTFGDNGAYLDFEDSDNLGDDESGNTNDWAETNLAAADQATDSPTNNFATLNSVVGQTGSTFSEGNCKLVTSSALGGGNFSTIAASAGKWYAEVKLTAHSAASAIEAIMGVSDTSHVAAFNDGDYTTFLSRYAPGNWGILNYSGRTYQTASGTAGVTDSQHPGWAVNDIMGIGLDCDNQRVYFSKNGDWWDATDGFGGGSPDDYVTIQSDFGEKNYVFSIGDSSTGSTCTWECNFGGCSAFAISSAVNDANGYGNFEYAPPSGFLALCTKNLGSDGG